MIPLHADLRAILVKTNREARLADRKRGCTPRRVAAQVCVQTLSKF